MHTTSTCLKRDVKLFSATNTLDTHFSYKTYYNRHNSIFQTNISLIIIDNSSAAYSLMHFFSGHYVYTSKRKKLFPFVLMWLVFLLIPRPLTFSFILLHFLIFGDVPNTFKSIWVYLVGRCCGHVDFIVNSSVTIWRLRTYRLWRLKTSSDWNFIRYRKLLNHFVCGSIYIFYYE